MTIRDYNDNQAGTIIRASSPRPAGCHPRRLRLYRDRGGEPVQGEEHPAQEGGQDRLPRHPLGRDLPGPLLEALLPHWQVSDNGQEVVQGDDLCPTQKRWAHTHTWTWIYSNFLTNLNCSWIHCMRTLKGPFTISSRMCLYWLLDISSFRFIPSNRQIIDTNGQAASGNLCKSFFFGSKIWFIVVSTNDARNVVCSKPSWAA